MSVPETTVHENDCPIPGQDYVRCSGQGAVMETVAETGGVERLAQDQFRLGILAPDIRHHPAAYFSRNSVSHVRPFVPDPVA